VPSIHGGFCEKNKEFQEDHFNTSEDPPYLKNQISQSSDVSTSELVSDDQQSKGPDSIGQYYYKFYIRFKRELKLEKTVFNMP